MDRSLEGLGMDLSGSAYRSVAGFIESGNEISLPDEAILAFRKGLGSMEHSLFNDADTISVYSASNELDGQ
jgi:hypothetical protein